MKPYRRRCLTRAAVLGALVGILPVQTRAASPRMLVVTATAGYRNPSIPISESVLAVLAERSGAFTLDYAQTEADLARTMTPEGLKKIE